MLERIGHREQEDVHLALACGIVHCAGSGQIETLRPVELRRAIIAPATLAGVAVMTREEIVALFDRREAAWRARDAAALAADHAPTASSISPTGGVLEGRADIERIYRVWFTAFADFVFTTEDLIIDGDRVALLGRVTGSHSGEFFGMPATGPPHRCRVRLLLPLRGPAHRPRTARSSTSPGCWCRLACCAPSRPRRSDCSGSAPRSRRPEPGRRQRPRQLDDEARAVAQAITLGAHRPRVRLDERPHDRQAQSPSPPSVRVSVVSTCQNGSNTRVRSAGAIPRPVSVTAIRDGRRRRRRTST